MNTVLRIRSKSINKCIKLYYSFRPNVCVRAHLNMAEDGKELSLCVSLEIPGREVVVLVVSLRSFDEEAATFYSCVDKN